MRPHRTFVLITVAFASGFAGLGYELAWTRALSTVIGQEVVAAVAVIAAFFLGLALGGFVLDRPIRQARRPWLAYAALEASIAVWGLAVALMLPWLRNTLPLLIGPAASAATLWTFAFVLPAVLLLPATVAMGGTLVALERILVSASSEGRVVGWAYGLNTLGAVAGVAASVTLLLPVLGSTNTLLALAAINAGCSLAAYAMAVRGPAAPSVQPTDDRLPDRLPDRLLDGRLFVTGLLGVGFEVVVVRLASQVLENTVFSFAALLAVYLLGTAAGALAYQFGRPRRRHGAAMVSGLLGLTALSCLAAAASVHLLPTLVALTRPAGLLASELAVAATMFLLPAVSMGALFTHLAQCVRDRRGSVGRAAGMNAAGAAMAPAIAVLVLIPGLGAMRTLVALGLGYVLLLPRSSLRASAPLGGLALAWAVWLSWPGRPPLAAAPAGGRVATIIEGPSATVGVVEDANGTRYLDVNGHFRMGGTSSRGSDWRQAAIPLLLHPDPHRVLLLGVGTGATLAGAARIPGVEATGVELIPEVVELLPWFDEHPRGGGSRPQPGIVTADARRFVRAIDATYDVIAADLFHPALDGSGALYTRDHFAAVRGRLAAGGLFCQWLPLHQLDTPSLRTIVRSFLAVFPDASAYLAHYSVQTPLLALIGPTRPGPLDPERIAARMGSFDGVLQRTTGLAEPIDLLGLYVGGAGTLRRFAGAGDINTDDRPVVTFDARRNVEVLSAPPAERLLALLDGTTPDASSLLGAAGLSPERQERLDRYWRARNRFLRAGSVVPAGLVGRDLALATAPELLEVVRISPDFDPAYKPLLAMGARLLRDDAPAARGLLTALAQAAPDRPDALSLLGRTGP